VRDLSAGSGLTFERLGPQRLKGLPEEVEVHRVTTPTSGLTPQRHNIFRVCRTSGPPPERGHVARLITRQSRNRARLGWCPCGA
jgi:hypothetical protein